jgi:hypothetical protein
MASSNLFGRPQVIPGHGTLTLERHAVLQEFHCANCNKDKKSKNTAHWDTADGMCKTVCNGCFGEILAKGPRQ